MVSEPPGEERFHEQEHEYAAEQVFGPRAGPARAAEHRLIEVLPRRLVDKWNAGP
jgi:hypothetical protein